MIDSLSRGGAERQALVLHRGLLERGHDSKLVCLGPPLDMLDDPQLAPQDVESLGTSRGWRHLPAAANALHREVRRFEPDVLHSSLMFSDLASGLVPRRTPRVATLCNVFDPGLRAEANPQASPTRMQVANRLWGTALQTRFDRCIAISGEVARSATACLGVGASRLTVIHRSIPRPTDTHAPPEGAPGIVSIGRLVPQKGQDILLRALAHLDDTGPAWTCTIIGAGWYRDSLESLKASLELDDRVTLAGLVPDSRVYLRTAAVFAFPSRYEGLGVSLLEAGCFGLPCVVSDIAPLREIIVDERFGFICRPNDPEDLARALTEALSDPVAARLRGRRLQERVATAFSETKMIDDTLAVYEAVRPD